MSRIPAEYQSGLPLYWRNEQSGELACAVFAYLYHMADGKPAPTPEEFALFREYLEYWVNAPCWSDATFEVEMKNLRERVKTLKTPREIQAWLESALETGIDPI